MKSRSIYLMCSLTLLYGYTAESNGLKSESSIIEKWKNMDCNFLNATNLFFERIKLIEITSYLNLSIICKKQGLILMSNMKLLKRWAFNFFDASTKMVEGITSGNFHFHGEYQECLDTFVPSRKSKKILFSGQYCQINIIPPLPPKSKKYLYNEEIDELKNFTGSEVVEQLAKQASMFYAFPLQMGLCVPSGCNENNVNQLVQIIAEKYYLTAWVNYCQVKENISLSVGVILAIFLIGILTLMVCIGTLMEVMLLRNQRITAGTGFCYRLVLSFSVRTNLINLFSMNISEDRLKSLKGIRFLSLIIFCICHHYVSPLNLMLMHAYRNVSSAVQMMSGPFGLLTLMSYSMVMETFFYVGGFLTSYFVTNRVKIDKKNLNCKSFLILLISWLWRVGPVYLFAVLFAVLTSMMGSGPIFKKAIKYTGDNCQKYWWRNLLFISNFFPLDETCMVDAWYIPCDLQLYLYSLIEIISLIHFPKVGFAFVFITIIASMCYAGGVTYIHELMPITAPKYMDLDFYRDAYSLVYTNPVTHAGAYSMGVLLGYISVMKRNCLLSKKIQVLGYFVTTLLSGYAIFWTMMWNYYSPTLLEESIYAGTHRVAWVSALAWMIFCCVMGYGGFINSLLSWNPWVPLTRLTLAIFLLQPTLEAIYVANFESTHEYKHFDMLVVAFGLFLMSGILAVGVNILIERPLKRLGKVFFRLSTEAETNIYSTITEVEGSSGEDQEEVHQHYQQGDQDCNIGRNSHNNSAGQETFISCHNTSGNVISMSNNLNNNENEPVGQDSDGQNDSRSNSNWLKTIQEIDTDSGRNSPNDSIEPTASSSILSDISVNKPNMQDTEAQNISKSCSNPYCPNHVQDIDADNGKTSQNISSVEATNSSSSYSSENTAYYKIIRSLKQQNS